jgi:hypothetical protein
MTIQILRNSEIDFARWDRSLSRSLNGNVFGLSWFLNITAPDWEALAENDYQMLMPLPVCTRWNRKLISMPPFTWQLGIYSNRIMEPDLLSVFLNRLPASYRIKGITLNKFNRVNDSLFKVHDISSVEIDLISSYEKIRRRYDRELINELEQSATQQISIIKGLSVNDFLQFAARFDTYQDTRIRSREINFLRLIITNSVRYRLGEIYGAYTPENNLCAAAFLITYRQKATLFMTLASRTGLQYHAVQLIIDGYIKLHAEQKLILGVDDPFDRKNLLLLKQFGAEPCKLNHITGRRKKTG